MAIHRGEPTAAAGDRPVIANRKAEHIMVSTAGGVEPRLATSWDDVHLPHCCLPEHDLDEVDLSVDFLGRKLSAPLVISSMTGGHELARSINGVLAMVAEEFGLAMGVGASVPSSRIAPWAIPTASSESALPMPS